MSTSAHPKVSIVSISYNQEDFIGQALESFLMQEANFSFEIIIADDCSTDKTARIIRDYTKKFPGIIKPILREKNKGIQENLIDALKHAKGEYVALCEGDDFWTDRKKLQIQADFLDSHPAASIVFHPVKVFFENKEEADEIFPEPQEAVHFTVDELLKRNFIQTNSVMYRRKSYDAIPNNILPMDWYLHLYHAQGGKIGFINRVMSAYRRQPGGVWWDAYKDVNLIWKKHGIAHLTLYIELVKLYEDSKKDLEPIWHNIDNIVEALKNTDKKYQTNLLEEATKLFPKIIAKVVVRLSESKQKLQHNYEKQLQEFEKTKELLTQEKEVSYHKNLELETIKSSKLWKVRNFFKR